MSIIFRLIFQQHSTFFVQTIYFALVLIENIILCCTPLYLFNESGSNRAIECLGKEKVYQCIVAMICASIGGWLCHAIYYTQMGHPWGAINGPEFRKNRFAFNIHHCGTERDFVCIWGRKKPKRPKSIEEITGEVIVNTLLFFNTSIYGKIRSFLNAYSAYHTKIVFKISEF